MELIQRSRSWRILVILQPNVESIEPIWRRNGGIVPFVFADISDCLVRGAAVADPDDVPGVAVGSDCRGLSMVGSVERPVD